MYAMAAKLGYKGLRVMGLQKNTSYKTLRLLIANNFPTQSVWTIAKSTPEDRARIESGKIRLLYGLESVHKYDKLHFRNSNLNQVICKLLQQKDIIVCFDFSLILKSNGVQRSIYLGRMQQNVTLCRKYKVPMAIASFAKTPYELRNPKDLISFGIVLGMHPLEAACALTLIGTPTDTAPDQSHV